MVHQFRRHRRVGCDEPVDGRNFQKSVKARSAEITGRSLRGKADAPCVLSAKVLGAGDAAVLRVLCEPRAPQLRDKVFLDDDSDVAGCFLVRVVVRSFTQTAGRSVVIAAPSKNMSKPHRNTLFRTWASYTGSHTGSD